MKNSILVGAAETAAVQSKSNTPSGATKEPKGHTGKLRTVAFTNTSRVGSSQKNEPIGLNRSK